MATAVVLSMLVASSSAFAAKSVVGVFGGNGTGPGQFGANGPRGVALAPNGDVYVVDGGNNRVQRFTSAGVFVSQLGTGASGAGNGVFNAPQGVAVNQADGSVYVTDGTNFRVQRFTSAGVFDRAWGWDVDATGGSPTTFEVCVAPAVCKIGLSGAGDGQFGSTFAGHPAVEPGTGNVVVADPGATANRRIQAFSGLGAFQAKFGASGTAAGQFGAASPSKVAVDAGGTVYAVDTGNNRVQKLTPSAGTYIATDFAPAALSGTTSVPFSVAIDPVSHRVFVARHATGGTSEIWVQELTSEGTLVDTHGVGAGIGQGASVNANSGLAYDRSTGAIYLAVADSVRRVFVLDEAATQPTAALHPTDPVTGVTTNGATFNGTVSPGGGTINTGYRFEYSADGTNWTKLPGTDIDLGNGSGGAVDPNGCPANNAQTCNVTQTVTGLQANKQYQVRLVATRQFNGPSATTAAVSFTTAARAPEIAAVAPLQRYSTSALLRAAVNAHNLPTEYRFEYGTDTGYGTSVPDPVGTTDSGIPGTVSAKVTGLTPDTTYHYRVVAINDAGTTTGPDETFRTTPAAVVAPEGRAYEMVTPPDKPGRVGGSPGFLGRAQNPGIPSADGNRFFWAISWSPLMPENAFPYLGDRVMFERTGEGWSGRSQLNLPPLTTVSNDLSGATPTAASRDLTTSTWRIVPAILPAPGSGKHANYTRRDGTGTEGWSPWLANPAIQTVDFNANDFALIPDDSSWMVRWGRYRGLLGSTAAEDSSVAQLAGNAGGQAIYRQVAPPTGGLELISGCTGTGADATTIPQRVGPAGETAGTAGATDRIATQSCETGAPTSLRGARVGSGRVSGGTTSGAVLDGTAANAASSDGRRVFFQSPDPAASGAVMTCANVRGPRSTGVEGTSCPAQLFVSQEDSTGDATVRWISRSRSVALGDNAYGGAMIAGQQIAEMGRGVVFEGASDDGRVVYFRTNAPLTPDDPNGGTSITTGAASINSWDLYRYELPADPDADPDSGALTRISGGPSGTADPNTNCSTQNDPLKVICNESNHGLGAVARYVSDDGSKAYFVTSGVIPGVPAAANGTTTSQSGTALNTWTTRNLYLFDATKSGADRWRFVAQIPFELPGGDGGNSCASSGALSMPMYQYQGRGIGTWMLATPGNCVRGTPDGNAIVFATPGALTADDSDTAVDLYLYDAQADELRRITAPPPGVEPYPCLQRGAEAVVTATCHGDLGSVTSLTGTAPAHETLYGRSGMRHANLALDDDGGLAAVYFESRSALVPEDVNGDHWDTYQWKDGELSLVSPGNTDDDAYYSGNSDDGESVFFNTSQPISPYEIDKGDYDIYVARVGGGGFPPPPTDPVPCDTLADSCQGDGASEDAVDSQTDAGDEGNVTPTARKTLVLGLPSAAARRRAARKGVLALRVRASSAGRIDLVATGRPGRSKRVVGRASKEVEPGRATIGLRLSKAARRWLRSGRALPLTIEVRQAGARSRSSSVVLRRAR